MRIPALLAVACFALAAAAPTPRAAERPLVDLVFDAVDRKVVTRYTPMELAELQQKGASAIARSLSVKFAFVRFAPGEATARYHLSVKLDRAEGSRLASTAELGFFFRLVGPEVREDAVAYLPFRDVAEYMREIPAVDPFVKEIELAFDTFDRKILVGKVLHYVAIATEATYLSDLPGWVVPHVRTTLCMDFGSVLTVRNNWPTAEGTAHPELAATVVEIERRDGLIVSQLDEQRDAAHWAPKLRQADPQQIRVDAVRVLEYHPFCPTGSAEPGGTP